MISLKKLFFSAAAALVCLCAAAQEQRTIKVLAIGNSFSQDSAPQNLHQIAAADGTTMVIGNMYIGGCSIQRHVNNVRNDAPAYQLTYVAADGSKKVIENCKLSEAIKMEDWDYVSVQQVSGMSGKGETYALLPELVDWVRAQAPQAEVVFHMTWAYAEGSNHQDFPAYDRDQWKMLDAIKKTVKEQTAKVGITRIIPTGIAIQNARTDFNDFNLTRDGFHLSLDKGRYIAALTWYEALSGRSVVGNSYLPDGSEAGTAAVSAADAAICQKAVHSAVMHNLTPAQAAGRFTLSPEEIASREEFSKSRLGIFIHWGVYSLMGDGEWVMAYQQLDNREYGHLAQAFYPSNFDAAQWVKAFKDAGADYITFTSRHHDGFSMWDSDASDYNIVDYAPFGRDVIGELAKACSEQDLRLHFYYSHLDWHRTDYWPRGEQIGSTYPHGRPDGDNTSWRHYEQFMLDQITELLTKYGPIGCIWFDGVWEKTTRADGVREYERSPYEFNLYEQYELIHSLQPGCLVANNHHTSPFPGEDVQVFERDVPGCNESGWSMNQEVAVAFPLETCTTMNNTWGYNINDHNYKSTEDILTLLLRTASKGANLLINIGPRPDGTIPDEAMNILHGMAEWMNRYGSTVRATEGGFAPEAEWGVQTRKDNVIYAHILKETATIELPYKNVKSITVFDGVRTDANHSRNVQVKFKKTATGITVTVPQREEGCFDQILAITLK